MSWLSRVCLTLLALSATPGLPITTAQAETVFSWKVEPGRPVRWFKPSPPGVLLVGTDREILGVSSDSGKVLWRIGPIRGSNADDVEVLDHSTVALFSAGLQDSSDVPPLSLVELRDGHTLWTRTKEGLLRSVGSFLVPGTGNLLVRATTSSTGSKKTAMLVNAASGHLIWTNEALGEVFDDFPHAGWDVSEDRPDDRRARLDRAG